MESNLKMVGVAIEWIKIVTNEKDYTTVTDHLESKPFYRS